MSLQRLAVAFASYVLSSSFAFVVLLHFGGTAQAESSIVATLDLQAEETMMKGTVRLDLGGGLLKGEVDLNVESDPESPPSHTEGRGSHGRFRTHVDLKGNYDGGSFGVTRGEALLSGTFTDDLGCVAKVSGAGIFKGSVSGPLGGVEIECDWTEVAFDGCRLKSPQPFAAEFHFTFPPTEVIPKLNQDTKRPAVLNNEQGQSREPKRSWATTIWIAVGVVAMALAGLALARRIPKRN